MPATAWVLIVALFASPLVHADEWEKALEDFELYDEALTEDLQEAANFAEDAMLEESGELFPIVEGSSSSTGYAMSDTHITIKVDGVPVVLNDVPMETWFAEYVKDVADRNLISGYRDEQGRPSGAFGPADSVTIEQLAKMAVIAGEIDPYACGEETKNALAIGRWSESYIRCAEHNNWIVYNDGSVDPERSATRAEVVVTILQAFKERISPRSGTVFQDVTTQTTYGAAIETAALKGIVSGYNDANGNPTGMFGPEDPVNRAETAKIFSLSFAVFWQQE